MIKTGRVLPVNVKKNENFFMIKFVVNTFVNFSEYILYLIWGAENTICFGFFVRVLGRNVWPPEICVWKCLSAEYILPFYLQPPKVSVPCIISGKPHKLKVWLRFFLFSKVAPETEISVTPKISEV